MAEQATRGDRQAAEGLFVRITYRTANDIPVQLANNFVLQAEPDGSILTVAQVVQPILLGTEAERRAAAQQITDVEAKVLGRYSISKSGLDQLIKLLTEHAERIDELAKGHDRGTQ